MNLRGLYIVFIFLLFGVSIPKGHSQSISTPESVTAKFVQISLLEVFSWLEEQCKIKIAYSKNVVADRAVNKEFTQASIEQVMQALLAETGLQYRFVDDERIIIGPKTTPPAGTGQASSQPEVISGQVRDLQSGTPLAFANILIPGSNDGTTTDESGNFSISVSGASNYGSIQVSYVGYEQQLVPLDNNREGLDIRMSPQAVQFEHITILETIPLLKVDRKLSAITMRPDRLSGLAHLPGGPDIMRNLQLLPGIGAEDDLSASLKVRGSAPDENMLMLDGMLLYNVDHLYGIFSAVSPEIISEVNVYKNAFPIEYSGRTASVIEMKTHGELPEKISGKLSVDFMTLSGYLDIPLGKSMSLTTAGRFTHQDVANSRLFEILGSGRSSAADFLSNSQLSNLEREALVEINPNFDFYDTYAKWKWNIGKDDGIEVAYYRGRDQYEYDYETDYLHIFDNAARKNFERDRQATRWSNEALGLTYRKKWNDNFRSVLNLSRSSYLSNGDQNLSYAQNFGGPNLDFERTTTFSVSDHYNAITGLRFDLKNTLKVNDDQVLTFGYNLVQDQVDFELVNRTRQRKIKLETRGREETNKFREIALEDSARARQHTLYAQYEMEPAAGWNLTAGVSGTYYDSTGNFYFSPRIQTTVAANEQLYFKASYSHYQQFLRQINHEDIFGENQTYWLLAGRDSIPVSTSSHYMMGFNWLGDELELDVEFYHKKLGGVIDYAMPTVGFNSADSGPRFDPDFRLFEGTGQTNGVDILLKRQTERYTGWLAYTLSKTTHTLKGINGGRPFAAQNDRRHQLKLINQYQFKGWTFSASYIFASGRPYLDPIKLAMLNSRQRSAGNFARALTRLPDYHRFDLGINYNWKLWGSRANVGLSIFNLLNHQNVRYRQYLVSIREEVQGNRVQNTIIGNQLNLLDRTVNLSFSVEF